MGDGVAFGEVFVAGEGFTAGVPFNAGVDVIVGAAFIAGDAETAGAGSRIGTVAEAIICHCPLRRMMVSTDRYWPLMSWAFESAGLYLPPLTVVWSVTTAASLSKTLTTISESSHESNESAPPSMSLMSRSLLPIWPSG